MNTIVSRRIGRPARRLLLLIGSWVAVAASAGSALAFDADSMRPCGGLELRDGQVVTGLPLATDVPMNENTRTCLQAIGKALRELEGLRAVTVALRLPAKQRSAADKRGLAAAATDLLAGAGLPRWRLSHVVPLTRNDEKAALLIAYSAKPAGRPVASVSELGGIVHRQRGQRQWQLARRGTLLRAGDRLRTGNHSFAVVSLADGSTLGLRPATAIRLGRIAIDAQLRRQVRIELLRGNLTSTVAPSGTGANFDIVTRVATAGVRGTVFRVDQNPASEGAPRTRLETLSGKVELAGSKGKVMVPAGTGSMVRADGRPSKPRKLLTGARPAAPLKGRVPPGVTLRWHPLKGAATWRVELARDADFTRSSRSLATTRLAMVLPADLAAGKWFWRLTPIDADGFVGMPSRIYAIVLAGGRP